jgi:microcystin-dependent protein
VIAGDQNVYVDFAGDAPEFAFDFSRSGVVVGTLQCEGALAPIPTFDHGTVVTERGADGSVTFTVHLSTSERAEDKTVGVSVLAQGAGACTMNLVHGGIVTNFHAKGAWESDAAKWANTPFVVVIVPNDA